MTIRPLPPPRALSAEQAAAHLGIGRTTFLREVAAGNLPAPITLVHGSKRDLNRWLIDALDAHLDRLAGREPNTTPENPFMARLRQNGTR